MGTYWRTFVGCRVTPRHRSVDRVVDTDPEDRTFVYMAPCPACAGAPDERTQERELRMRALALATVLRGMPAPRRPGYVEALVALAVERGFPAERAADVTRRILAIADDWDVRGLT